MAAATNSAAPSPGAGASSPITPPATERTAAAAPGTPPKQPTGTGAQRIRALQVAMRLEPQHTLWIPCHARLRRHATSVALDLSSPSVRAPRGRCTNPNPNPNPNPSRCTPPSTARWWTRRPSSPRSSQVCSICNRPAVTAPLEPPRCNHPHANSSNFWGRPVCLSDLADLDGEPSPAPAPPAAPM